MYFKSTSVFSRFENILKFNEVLYVKDASNKFIIYYEEHIQKDILVSMVNGFAFGAGIKVKIVDITCECFMAILTKRS